MLKSVQKLVLVSSILFGGCASDPVCPAPPISAGEYVIPQGVEQPFWHGTFRWSPDAIFSFDNVDQNSCTMHLTVYEPNVGDKGIPGTCDGIVSLNGGDGYTVPYYRCTFYFSNEFEGPLTVEGIVGFFGN